MTIRNILRLSSAPNKEFPREEIHLGNDMLNLEPRSLDAPNDASESKPLYEFFASNLGSPYPTDCDGLEARTRLMTVLAESPSLLGPLYAAEQESSELELSHLSASNLESRLVGNNGTAWWEMADFDGLNARYAARTTRNTTVATNIIT